MGQEIIKIVTKNTIAQVEFGCINSGTVRYDSELCVLLVQQRSASWFSLSCGLGKLWPPTNPSLMEIEKFIRYNLLIRCKNLSDRLQVSCTNQRAQAKSEGRKMKRK